MSTIADRVKKLSVPASSVKHSKRIVRTITKSDIDSVNRSIQPKIDANKKEQHESWIDGHDKIVG